MQVVDATANFATVMIVTVVVVHAIQPIHAIFSGLVGDIAVWCDFKTLTVFSTNAVGVNVVVTTIGLTTKVVGSFFAIAASNGVTA